MYTKEEKIIIINEFRNSGAKIKDYVGTRNISVPTLRSWIKAYNKYGEDGLESKWKINKKNTK